MGHQYDAASNYESSPIGIKLFCVVAGLIALYLMVLSLNIMAAGGQFFSLGALFFMLGVGYLAVLYGLWMLRSWGWKWGMFIFAFDLVVDLFQADPIGVLISVVLLAYLWSKRSLYL